VKVAVTPVGTPWAAKVTALVKPPLRVTVIVMDSLAPAWMVQSDSEEAMTKLPSFSVVVEHLPHDPTTAQTNRLRLILGEIWGWKRTAPSGLESHQLQCDARARDAISAFRFRIVRKSRIGRWSAPDALSCGHATDSRAIAPDDVVLSD
jgi:hypothetical protein